MRYVAIKSMRCWPPSEDERETCGKPARATFAEAYDDAYSSVSWVSRAMYGVLDTVTGECTEISDDDHEDATHDNWQAATDPNRGVWG